MRISALDGIRGLAVLLVLASHASNPNAWVFRGTGKLGVYLFFVLSAFLLTEYFVADPSRIKRPIQWLNYGMRRLARIYPLYALVLVIDYLVGFSTHDLGTLADQLTLKYGLLQYWTIPIEMRFYLVLPAAVLFIALVARSRAWIAIAGWIAFTVAHQVLVPTESMPKAELFTNLLPFLPVFLAGSVAATVHNQMRAHELSRRVRVSLDVLACLVLVVVLVTFPSIWSVVVGRNVPLDFFHRGFVYFGVAWAVIIVATLNGAGYVRRLFESPPMRFAGAISFSAYLTHEMLLDAGSRVSGGNPAAAVTIGLGATVVVASVLYAVAERPLSRLSLLRRDRPMSPLGGARGPLESSTPAD